eukprot:443032-Amphidinium_carterae.1
MVTNRTTSQSSIITVTLYTTAATSSNTAKRERNTTPACRNRTRTRRIAKTTKPAPRKTNQAAHPEGTQRGHRCRCSGRRRRPEGNTGVEHMELQKRMTRAKAK